MNLHKPVESANVWWESGRCALETYKMPVRLRVHQKRAKRRRQALKMQRLLVRGNALLQSEVAAGPRTKKNKSKKQDKGQEDDDLK